MSPRSLLVLWLALAGLVPSGARATTIRGAVAANFAATAEVLGRSFSELTGHEVVWSPGSTGKLYAQIVQGAPFDLFLAADEARPARLEAEGLAVPGSRFTYAEGRLALWSPGRRASPEFLWDPDLRVAIANPSVAPYGEAARDVLLRLGVWGEGRSRWVRGEDVGQTFGFVWTGGVDIGLVALSSARQKDLPAAELWIVPSEWHRRLAQQAVRPAASRSPEAAEAFLEFLRSARAREIVEAAGYDVPDPIPGA